MFRFITVSLAAAVSLFAAGIATAAPEAGKAEAKSVCTAGIGKAVCCKAFVADHCNYVSCCEAGNSAFFTAKSCAKCADHRAQHAAAHSGKTAATPAVATTGAKTTAAKSECAAGACCASDTTLYVAACERGNGGFFTSHTAHTASAKSSACCAAGAKAK